jgi:hypothetical protein
MKRMMKSLFVGAMALFVMAGAAQAGIIYHEDFTTQPASTSVSAAFGWSAYRDNGVNYSTSTADPLYVNYDAGADASKIFSSSQTILNTDFALISDAGAIDPGGYQSDLTISFTEDSTDEGTKGNIFWRVLVQVGSDIYASNTIASTATTSTKNVVAADSVWRLWTDETDLTNGFDMSNISTTAGVLPAGSMSNIALLLDDGPDANDRQRLYDFSITGTVIPEPASGLMLLGAMLGLGVLRRKLHG